MNFVILSSLIHKLLPCRKLGREPRRPGRSDHVSYYVWFYVLFLVIELLSTQSTVVVVLDVTENTGQHWKHLARLNLLV